ncbi:Glycosyltransferase family 1 protein [Rhizoctonia solani]|uniref:Glycosyltransferase family 1 protein n=1 Tax=Rhizoctonia solani TaxID=456999 RepID=A0A8H7HEG2_9AGAM|nr:Glycosyltransferase family 1 protein [Rhizoctonia solani]
MIFIPGPPWGHLRPGMKTALRLVEKFHGIFICLYLFDFPLSSDSFLAALFVYQTEVHKAVKYLDAQRSTYTRRIRIVTSSNNGGPSVSLGNPIGMIESLEEAFSRWIAAELCQATIIQVDGRPVNAPTLIIEDIFTGGISLTCKDVHSLPVVGWWLMPAASLICHLEMIDMSISRGTQDAQNLIQYKLQSEDVLTKSKDLSPQDISNLLVCVPGIPPHYQWEMATQELPFAGPVMSFLLGRWKAMVERIDTVISCTTFEMEPISATALPKFIGKGLEQFCIGPSVDLTPPRQPDPNSPVTQFLDRAYAENGAHSIIYISFGTLFFPLLDSIPHLMAVLDEISKFGYRFIFALSSASATLDKSWMDGHIDAGNAIFPQWTNQTAVLEHPAIHYFLSHGGWNSTTEALVRGVPMIFWPMGADQPTNAIQIAAVHDCGFELLQVRTGPAKFVAYQNGREVEIVGTDDAVRDEMGRILKMSKGTRGRHQRMNVQMLGRVITESLGPGGSGDIALERLGVKLGLV